MILPLHTQPRSGEILSSWLVRLALDNGLPVHTFYYSLLQYPGQIWTRDIDRHPPKDLIHIVARATAQTLERVVKLSLTSYEGRIYESLPTHGDAPWLIPAGIYHRTRIRPGMQFCPVCLSTDDFPYYRKAWRTSLTAMCEIHHCLLSEYCPCCNSPIAFHQHAIGRSKSLTRDAGRLCHSCHFDFSLISSAAENVDRTLRDGYAELLGTLISNNENYLSLTGGIELLLFKGVRALVGAISGRNGGRLRQVLSKLLQIQLDPDKGKDFEYQNVQYRFNLMLCIVWLLNRWPERFCEICAEARFTRSRFSEDYQELPFWIWSVIDNKLNFSSVTHSPEEVDSALRYLVVSGQTISWQSLGSILGLKKDSAKFVLNRWMARARMPQDQGP